MPDIRSTISGQVRALVGSDELDLSRPEGDDGLFGPGSAVWRVHGDFTAMMIGGLSSLLLQMLHPAALAGVWAHSNFRRDPLGRLKRTAQFVTVTSYGATAAAEQAIAKVRGIHDRVRGTLPDGTPYAASDPALLTWVHVAEVDSFLRAHLRYRDPALPGAVQDAYLAEYARVARALGAENVPTSRAQIAAYYADLRPRLRCDAQTREVADTILRPSAGAAGPPSIVLNQAALDLLPPWAQALHGRATPSLVRPAIRLAAGGLGRTLRWALSAA